MRGKHVLMVTRFDGGVAVTSSAGDSVSRASSEDRAVGLLPTRWSPLQITQAYMVLSTTALSPGDV